MNNDIILNEGERLDDLQLDGLQIIQHKDKFCFGIDAVLLSDFVQVGKNVKLLDLCTGGGILPILLSAKIQASHIDAIELQEDIADMAKRGVSYNKLDKLIDIYRGDLREAQLYFKPSSYDAITVNPPYMNYNHGLKNTDLPKAIARHEIYCSLEDVLKQGHDLLKPGGHFFMVHRPFRLAEILSAMVNFKLEPKRLRLVYPYVDKEPNMVLIEGVKHGRSRIKVEAPLIVYEGNNIYTKEILKIYGKQED